MPISSELRTPSVASRPQLPAQGRRCAAAVLALAVSFCSSVARAAEPAASVSQPAQQPPPASQPTTNYALPLGLAYAGAPFLAYAIAGGHSDTGRALLGSLAFTLPAIVHFYHGETARGLLTFPGEIGTMLAGGALGLLIGGALSSCDPKNSECDETGIADNLTGAAIGVVLGYLTYAIIDVAANSTVSPTTNGGHDVAAMQLWIQPLSTRSGPEPLLGGRASGAPGDVRLSGGMLGISIQL